jgi:hypothetical protein
VSTTAGSGQLRCRNARAPTVPRCVRVAFAPANRRVVAETCIFTYHERSGDDGRDA